MHRFVHAITFASIAAAMFTSAALAPVRAQTVSQPSGPAKKSTAEKSEERVTQKADEKLPQPQAFAIKREGPRATDFANDFWFTPTGAFHMVSVQGRGIYKLPGLLQIPRDSRFIYVDDLPVDGRVGWTYKDALAFGLGDNYMFFSKYP